MRKLIFILLFTVTLNAQDFWTWKKAAQIGVSFIAGYTEGQADFAQYQKFATSGSERIEWDRAWHRWKYFSRGGQVLMGVSIPLNSEFKFWHTVSDALMSVAIWGLAHKISYNFARGESAFYQSDYQKEHKTGGWVENFDSPFITIGSVIITIGINYFIYKLL